MITMLHFKTVLEVLAESAGIIIMAYYPIMMKCHKKGNKLNNLKKLNETACYAPWIQCYKNQIKPKHNS